MILGELIYITFNKNYIIHNNIHGNGMYNQ